MPETRNVLEEQIRKGSAALPTRLPWQLLIFSFAILAVTAAGYFGMVFGFQPYLNSQLDGINAQIENLEKTVNKQQQESLTNLYSQLTNIQDLLDSHVVSSSLMDELEKITYPQVYYTSVSLSLVENRLKLSGIASSYEFLSRQLDSFKNDGMFESVLLENAKSVGEGISFSAQAFLAPGALK